MDRGAWWAMVQRVTKSQTRLKGQNSTAQHPAWAEGAKTNEEGFLIVKRRNRHENK